MRVVLITHFYPIKIYWGKKFCKLLVMLIS